MASARLRSVAGEGSQKCRVAPLQVQGRPSDARCTTVGNDALDLYFTPKMTPTIPFNRIVAFAGPYISLVAGAVAAALVAKANVLGIDGLAESNVATQVAGGLTFTLVAVLSWLGNAKWLAGHRVAALADARVAAAAFAPAAAAAAAASAPAPPVENELVSDAAIEELLASEPFSPPPIPGPAPALVVDDALAEGAVAILAPTVVDEALPADANGADGASEPDEDGTPDELRVLMPSEEPLEGEPDEDDAS
jgi:hypothetical protein